MKKLWSLCVLLSGLGVFCAGPAWTAHFEVFSPAKGSRVQLGKSCRIRWQARDISGYLKIVLYNNFGQVGVVQDMVGISTGHYLWKAGRCSNGMVRTPKGRYRIKLESMAGGHVAEGYSEYFFLTPSMEVLSPRRGNAWPTGKTKRIMGAVLGYNGAVNLELWEGKQFKGRIAQGLNVNNRSFVFHWKVPNLLNGQTVSLQAQYHVKAVAVQGGLSDLSGPFTIIMGPSPVDRNLNPRTLKKPSELEQRELR